MSAAEAATEIAEVAADGVADGMHIVSEEALAAEKAVRGLNGIKLGYFGLGLAAGTAIGGFIAFRVAYAKAEEKYSAIADEEIAEMREHYRQKAVAQDAQEAKGDLQKIVEERGYASTETAPPMAVTPPAAVVEAAEEADEEEAEQPPAPEEDPEPEARNVWDTPQPPEEDAWDWHKERARRSPLRPYVIHRDEREEQEAYDGVTYTYYEQDDVVCNERDEVLSEEERERIIGEENLGKFGHGSGDATVVYVRNDKLEMDMEIIQSPNSYAEEVHGLEPTIRHAHRRRGRTPIDDE